MRYYKIIENGYITAIGTGDGSGTDITEQEYNAIMDIIRNKPERTENSDFRLKQDLTWEEYERIEEPVMDDDAEEEDEEEE